MSNRFSKPCEDRMCVVNNGKGYCTHEGVIVGRDPCVGWREPGGEWQLKYNLGEYRKWLKGEREFSPMDTHVPVPDVVPDAVAAVEPDQSRLEVF